MDSARARPQPEHTIVCSGTTEWKQQAELLAADGKPLLLIGANDADFVERLKKIYNLDCEVDSPGNKILVWNPKKTGIECS